MAYYIVPNTVTADMLRERLELISWNRYLLYRTADSPIVECFETPDRAHSFLAEQLDAADLQVVFLASPEEVIGWRCRERDRFATGYYTHVPWHDQIEDKYPDHYVHMSRDRDGLIAYTKSIEDGLRDRQTRVRPGRYLEQYYGDLPKTQRDAWIAECTSHVAQLRFARSADEIEWIYTHGPSSCMSHKYPYEYQSSMHPVRVYGDSDLALAWYGTGTPGKDARASARGLVWPDKKLYGRLYGDTDVLKRLLEAAGYSSPDGWSSLRGARIRAIEENGAYIVPYVDGDYICTGSLSRDGRWIVLDGDGDINLRQTCGLSEERDDEDTYNTCDRCNERYNVHNDNATENYCASCNEDRVLCDGCNEYDWSDNMTQTNTSRSVCHDCYREERRECEICDSDFFTGDFSRREARVRDENGTAALCGDCAESHRPCAECDTWTENDPHPVTDRIYCDDCAPAHEHDTADTDTLPLPLIAPSSDIPSAPISTIEALPHLTLIAAFQQSTWTRAETIGQCHLADCRAPINVGDIVYRHPIGFAYCRPCMLIRRDCANIKPFPEPIEVSEHVA